MKTIKGVKATYTVEEVNDIGDYRVVVNGHETIKDGTYFLVGNFNYQGVIDRIEAGKRMIV